MQYKLKTLPNGLRIIAVPIKASASVTVLALNAAGSEYETKRINGVSHFLEHMCFKGTKVRSTARAISEEIESFGGRSNAFTSQEYTGYFIKSEARHFKHALEIVADIFLNSTFPKEEIEKERGVIIQEIGKYEDEPSSHVFDLFNECLYGDQPTGWKVTGTPETVRNITRNDFLSYRGKHYVARATVVIVAGNVEPGAVFKEVGKAFRGIPTDKKYPKKKTRVSDGEQNVCMETRANTSQTHLVLGFPSYPIGDKRFLAANVLGAVLGAGMSSRLFQRIREEMGVAYSVFSGNESAGDHGEFFAYAGIEKDSAEEVIIAISEELRRLKEELLSEDELERVKNYIAGGLAIGLETGDRLAEFYGKRAVLGRPILTPQELTKKIHRITAKDIMKVARDLFQSERAHLALIGPYKSNQRKKFEKLLIV